MEYTFSTPFLLLSTGKRCKYRYNTFLYLHDTCLGVKCIFTPILVLHKLLASTTRLTSRLFEYVFCSTCFNVIRLLILLFYRYYVVDLLAVFRLLSYCVVSYRAITTLRLSV